ncbi:MAG TPA: aldolase/citrate lyase family protein [Opitutaceae bacterium]|nr:aldolase/citrate lyase family protein [Opitutaceae bacterium]
MSTTISFRSRVLAGDSLAGSFINLGSPITAEIAGRAGFDWLLLDHEHGPGSDETLLHQLHAISGTQAIPIVRIAANEPTRFKRVLDLGAGGVMVPYVNTAAEAEAAVAAVRYPPRGTRGVSKFNRAAGFGQEFDDYYSKSHERLVTMVQIETPEAVAHAAAIAAVDGVDVLFVGPLDLTTNMGIQGDFDHPRFVEARKQVAEAAKKAGKAVGILITAASQIPTLRAEGYTVNAFGSDGGAVTAGLRQSHAALRAK